MDLHGWMSLVSLPWCIAYFPRGRERESKTGTLKETDSRLNLEWEVCHKESSLLCESVPLCVGSETLLRAAEKGARR